MKTTYNLIFSIILMLSLAACNSILIPTPTRSSPTNIPTLSSTLTSTTTLTPMHTPTLTSTPTYTPTPTITFTPIPTPIGGLGQLIFSYSEEPKGTVIYDLTNNTNEQINTQFTWRFDWSSVGTIVAYNRSSTSLCRYFIDRKQEICKSKANGIILLDLSPDGKNYLAFHSHEYKTAFLGSFESDIEKEFPIIHSGQMKPHWSNDGSNIAGDNDTGVFLFNMKQKQIRYILHPGLTTIISDGKNKRLQIELFDVHSWAPDDSAILISAHIVGMETRELFSVTPDGSTIIRLTNNEYQESSPLWLRNGDIVWCPGIPPRSGSPWCRPQIRNFQTGKTTSMIKDKTWGLSLSPDSSLIVYLMKNEELEYEIYVFDPASSESTILVRDLSRKPSGITFGARTTQ